MSRIAAVALLSVASLCGCGLFPSLVGLTDCQDGRCGADGSSDDAARDLDGTSGSDAGSDAGLDVPGTVFGDDAGATCGGAFPTIDLYDTAQFARYRRTERTSSNATRAVVSGLSNGGTYRCVVVAEDLAGNRTVSSPTQCVTPVPVTDFWERYRSAGGGARPECAAHPGDGASSRYGAFGVAALVALAARRRRRA